MSASLAARAIPTRSHTSRCTSRKTPSRHARRRGGRAVGAANAGDPLFALSVLEVGGDVLLSDGDVAAAAVGALAATSLASLGTADPGAELRRKLDAVEPLEVRLDVTALWCFVCARELSHVPPGGKVVDLGFSVGDILRLGCVAGTGSCLCIAWLLVGTATGQFKRAGFLATGDERTLVEYLTPGWITATAAGALWQLAEAYLCRPGLDGVGAGLDGGDASLAPAAAAFSPPDALAAVAALVAAMQGYRAFSYFVP